MLKAWVASLLLVIGSVEVALSANRMTPDQNQATERWLSCLIHSSNTLGGISCAPAGELVDEVFAGCMAAQEKIGEHYQDDQEHVAELMKAYRDRQSSFYEGMISGRQLTHCG